MSKIKTAVICFTFMAFFALGSVSVKADTATANNMIPYLKLMYHVNDAENILSQNREYLKQLKKSNATAFDIASAQAAVTDAANLVNVLNAMVARDVTLISAAPAGVVNPPTFAVNSLTAQGAWSDYLTKAKYGHALIFPTLKGKTDHPAAYAPFCMY